MIPKIIHLCWFSNDPFPVEIKVCLDTWKRILPDFQVKHWTYQDAKAIGCRFINEALEARKWAFAADAVRFYAIYNEGGIYICLLYTSPSPRDMRRCRMPSSA